MAGREIKRNSKSPGDYQRKNGCKMQKMKSPDSTRPETQITAPLN